MTRFCAVLASAGADSDITAQGGRLVFVGVRCALGTLPDAQLSPDAGPHRIVPVGNGAAPGELIAVGQVTLTNRAALLAELEQAGRPAHAAWTDGELLLHFYAYAGQAGFAQVSGMFACAIWDGTRLVLVRDAAGARTLFYTRAGDAWAAASSLRALRRWPRLVARLNFAAVPAYLTFAYLPGDDTLLDGVYKLLPGHCLTLWPDGSSELRAYWHLREPAWDPNTPPEAYVAHLRALLDAEVQASLPAAQPVAVLLSGGIDSSLVAALAARLHDQPVTSYAIHFREEQANELAYAELVATHCGTQHHVLTFSGRQVVGLLAETMALLDSPVGDPLTVPNLLLARRAAADGFRTILNGEGGDPCFGGPKNLPMLLFELYRGDPDPAARARAYLRSYRQCYDDLPRLLSPAALDALRGAEPLERLVLPYLEAPEMSSFLNRLMLANVCTKGTHHILNKVEALSSACGLEAHSPLFARRIVEYSFAIPPALKLAGTTEKWVLKEAVRDLLPALIVERPKSGMRIPMYRWLRGPLGDLVREVLLSPQGQARGLFRAETLHAWLRDDGSFGPRHANRLWLLVTLELWLRAYLDDVPAMPLRRRAAFPSLRLRLR